jgi:hypothetical protein
MRIRFVYQPEPDYKEDCTESHLVTVKVRVTEGRNIDSVGSFGWSRRQDVADGWTGLSTRVHAYFWYSTGIGRDGMLESRGREGW